MNDITPFRQYLISELRARSSLSFMFPVPNTYYHIACGTREPDANDLADVADYLGVSFAYMMGLYVGTLTGGNNEPDTTSIDLQGIAEPEDSRMSLLALGG